MNHVLSLKDLSKSQIMDVLELAERVKEHPQGFSQAAFEKTLLMLFEVPSLRTMLSFETAMTQMGGHAINYHAEHSPWGHGKEIIEDVGRVVSRYVDVMMVRIHDHEELQKLAKHSSIPVLNGLTSYAHPCQVLADLLTMKEKKGRLEDLRVAYVGDSLNNVTHDLMFAASLVGFELRVGCPREKKYTPLPEVVKSCAKFSKKSGGKVNILHNPVLAVKGADVVVTDSWMSYRIPKILRRERMHALGPYQVNKKLFGYAKKDAIFMHCLPAWRGHEVTSDVIDSRRSVVFDEAENRLHAQKALIMSVLKGK